MHMTSRSALIAGIVALWGLSASGQPAAIAVVNVSVVPMDRDRVLAGQTVVVTDGTITAMGPANTVAAPAGAQRIDGAGKFLMPGLADMHVHFPTTRHSAGRRGGGTPRGDLRRARHHHRAEHERVARGSVAAPANRGR